MTAQYYTHKELQEFKDLQKLAYECVLDVEQRLQEGMTEKRVAQLMENFLHKKGIKYFFHGAFAWFGERTKFQNFHKPGFSSFKKFSLPMPHTGKEFMNSDQTLKDGMAVILDIAPIKNRIAVDIGYSFSFGENLGVEAAKKDLLKFREMILNDINSGKTLAEAYKNSDDLIVELGYQSCHGLYPLGVIGHKVGKLNGFSLPKFRLRNFQPYSVMFLTKELLKDKLKGESPFWSAESNFTPSPGLWAVEPHFGKDDYGVKFEEILVVTDNGAYWLDDNLPHVKV